MRMTRHPFTSRSPHPPAGRSEPLTAHPADAEERKADWAAKHGLRESQSARPPLAWLRGHQRPRRWEQIHEWEVAERGFWEDHVTLWLKDGKPFMVVSQPYHLTPEALAELGELTQEFDVSVDGAGSWHYPGHTILVEIGPRR